MALPRPLFRLFSVFFKQTIQILQQINVITQSHKINVIVRKSLARVLSPVNPASNAFQY